MANESLGPGVHSTTEYVDEGTPQANHLRLVVKTGIGSALTSNLNSDLDVDPLPWP